MTSAGAGADFGSRARDYDRLRPRDAGWDARFGLLVREGDLRGRKVLDVGCGTGALLTALVEEAHAKAWGVDPSPEMLAVAREQVPRGVGLKEGSAEALPFRDGWFERVVFSLSVHLVDRRVAFGEAARVLAPGGRVAIATFAPGHFGRGWLDPYFPSLAAVDRARFPAPEELAEELRAAGFEPRPPAKVETHVLLDREHALARLHGRHISTFDLLEPAEVERGIAWAERALPARVESRHEQVVVTADR